MDAKPDAIGLVELLDQITADLDELRRKVPNDYTSKAVVQWWDLEKERLLVRHGHSKAVKKLRQAQSAKRMMLLFFAGWLTMIAIQLALRLALA